MDQPFWKRLWMVLIKLNMQLSCNPATVFLDSYVREMKTRVHKTLYRCSQKPVHKCLQQLYLQ